MNYAHFYLLAAYVLVPVLISLVLIRGKWSEILKAYGIWIALLGLIGFMQGGAHGEGYGWAIIIAMFSTFIAIPVLVLVQKVVAYFRARAMVAN